MKKSEICSWGGENLPPREHGKAQGAFTSREFRKLEKKCKLNPSSSNGLLNFKCL